MIRIVSNDEIRTFEDCPEFWKVFLKKRRIFFRLVIVNHEEGDVKRGGVIFSYIAKGVLCLDIEDDFSHIKRIGRLYISFFLIIILFRNKARGTRGWTRVDLRV